MHINPQFNLNPTYYREHKSHMQANKSHFTKVRSSVSNYLSFWNKRLSQIICYFI